MQIVIEIPDNFNLENEINTVSNSVIRKALKNGTPLPEHHGKLFILDENLVKQHLVPFDCSNNLWLNEIGIALSTIKTIPTTKEGDGE